MCQTTKEVYDGIWSFLEPMEEVIYFYLQQLSDFNGYSKAWSSQRQFHWPLLILYCSPEADEIVFSLPWFSVAFWSPPGSWLLLLHVCCFHSL